MKIYIKVSTGYVGSDSEDYINEQAFEHMITNMIDWTWWEEDKE